MSEATATSSFLNRNNTPMSELFSCGPWSSCLLSEVPPYSAAASYTTRTLALVQKIPCAVTGGGCLFFRQLDSIPFDNIVIHHCSVFYSVIYWDDHTSLSSTTAVQPCVSNLIFKPAYPSAELGANSQVGRVCLRDYVYRSTLSQSKRHRNETELL